MKKYILSIFNCLCLLLCGCITEYTPSKIDELADILVVEGIITDNETIITLSRSAKLSEESINNVPVANAEVYVECDDGTIFHADSPDLWSSCWRCDGRYTIQTGQLKPDCKYRLKIEIEEPEGDCGDYIACPTKVYEYCSDFSYPIITPEVDSVFWMKRGRGQPVMIYVSTHDPENKIAHYRWSFKEDWEIVSELWLDGYPYYCWNLAKNKDLLIGSAEKMVFGRLMDKITEISPSSRKLSEMYRIDVTQNAISKRAYDYFANIQKNSQQTGSIFAPIPSELRGNITCKDDPDRPVIGYVDVSTTTKKRRYISRFDNVYEAPRWECDELTKDELCAKLLGNCDGVEDPSCQDELNKRCQELIIPPSYVLYYVPEPPDPEGEPTYVPVSCVDCRYYGTTKKPDDWPNNH